MPRPSDYLFPGYTYHLTQRCHDRRFLLRFSKDREAYRDWLRLGARRFKVPVYGYCITSNHVHVIAHADREESVSRLMHLAAGATAKQYNLRKGREGAMWQRPFHCTLIEDGTHLLNALLYVNLNMVRAGVVAHPEAWRWCGHDEMAGHRERYRVVNTERLVHAVGCGSADELREWYLQALARRIEAREFGREACWTEAVAVGSRPFVTSAGDRCARGRKTELLECAGGVPGGAWMVREARSAYGAI